MAGARHLLVGQKRSDPRSHLRSKIRQVDRKYVNVRHKSRYLTVFLQRACEVDRKTEMS
ncbi:hypothetical protein CKA32_000238 [Geitlerinema sp. FC II]|nr:hypothetical protein CKA32_000238 [Geitlerinema sp. FC II]